MQRSSARVSGATIAGAGPRQFAYSANHPQSPLALAWDIAGPVLVTDNLRADVAHAVDRTMWRRAYALGLISTGHGFRADEHQTYSGLFQDLANPADYLAKWVETGCQWAAGEKRDAIDQRAERTREEPEPVDELDSWAQTLVGSADTPSWWVSWGSNLVYASKFEYLVRLGAHAWLGAPAPRDPGTGWSKKMDAQWIRRSARCERLSK